MVHLSHLSSSFKDLPVRPGSVLCSALSLIQMDPVWTTRLDVSLKLMLELSDYSDTTAMRSNNGNTPLIEVLSHSYKNVQQLSKIEDMGSQI